MDHAKQIWEDLGASDAYYAVATFEKFRKGNLDEAAKAEFFDSGREHVERIWKRFEKSFGVSPDPVRALDYGCGVGRILLALAEKCRTVVGVDISNAMLEEARRNCENHGVTNVELQDAAEFQQDEAEVFDFVHSYIVLQHIDPKIGYGLIRKIIRQLEPGGFGMLHVTFFDPAPRFQKMRARIYRDFPVVHDLMCRLKGKKRDLMPMYEYNLDLIFRMLHENGCGENFIELSDHGLLGALVFFRKSPANPVVNVTT